MTATLLLTVSTVDPCITSNFTFRANLTFLGSPAGYEAPNEQACVNNCAADYFCVGVDVDYQRNPVLCWPHTNRNDYNIVYSQPGTNSYERIFECPGRFFSFFSDFCSRFIHLLVYGLDREMSTQPTLSCGVWPIYLYLRLLALTEREKKLFAW